MGYNKIYFGCPGTGKSHQVEIETNGKEKFITTFHPDYDYSSLVGSYKPISINQGGKQIIEYNFVPQVFLKAYVAAWLNPKTDFYIIIEEINRGNCAQIFGDLFQLLDRDQNGFSKYFITIDTDIAHHLGKAFDGSDYVTRISDLYMVKNKIKCNNPYENICLPSNLILFATMNTSDQSLFPMDSAFKRRWDWQYVPINYSDANTLKIHIDGNVYSWGNFIKIINPKIKSLTGSEDKQMGNRFVNPSDSIITLEQFRSKILFYLWSEIYKDEQNTTDNIFRIKVDDLLVDFQFGDLYTGLIDKNITALDLIKSFMLYNGILIE